MEWKQKPQKIPLLPHDPTWEAQAQAWIARLESALGAADGNGEDVGAADGNSADMIAEIRHVGATAVETLQARPILDIFIALRFGDILPRVRRVLEREGFTAQPDKPGIFARFLHQGRDEGTPMCSVSVVEAGGMAWRNAVNFAAYMRAFPQYAAEHNRQKGALWAASGSEETYNAGKAELFAFPSRRAMVWSFLGLPVRVEIDRPVGYVHHKKNYTLTYPINYGYIPGVLGGDGEELDVYILGTNAPLTTFDGQIIAIVYREDDVEDKLVAAPPGVRLSAREIEDAIRFQEQYYHSHVEVLP